MARRARKPVTRRERSTASPGPGSLQRVVIEAVEPQVDCGRFPIKRVVGERVTVTADIHADGHDAIAAALQYRRTGAEEWSEVPMTAADNDRWQGTFVVEGS